jgi:hypothetical protein
MPIKFASPHSKKRVRVDRGGQGAQGSCPDRSLIGETTSLIVVAAMALISVALATLFFGYLLSLVFSAVARWFGV